MAELTTLARPYADAVFARATQTDKLDVWSDMLALLATVVADDRVSALIGNPEFSAEQLSAFLIDIGGGRLTDEGQNLVKLLAHNDRVALLPEIAGLFETAKSEREGKVDVEVVSAYPVNAAQEQALADALKARLGREVNISSSEDKSLLGGVKVRAGDLVIDGSVRGQLTALANQLGA